MTTNCEKDIYYSRVSLNARKNNSTQMTITDGLNKKGVTFARMMCLPNAPANPFMQCRSNETVTRSARACATRDMYCCDGLCENNECCTRANSERANTIVRNYTLYDLTAMDELRKQRQAVMQEHWLRMLPLHIHYAHVNGATLNAYLGLQLA
jgi:hypothetical protein